MRRGLGVLLAATLAVTGWALLTPEPATAPAGVVAARAPAAVSDSAPVRPPLPAQWEAPVLEPARRDPFAADRPTAPKPSEPPPAPRLVVVQPAAPAAAVPAAASAAPAPFSYRFLGRMVDPSGRPMVYIARGETALAIEPGMKLSDGYTVETVSATSIEFVDAATQRRHALTIPADGDAVAAGAASPPSPRDRP